MNGNQLELNRRTPAVIWFIRLCFMGLVVLISTFWISNSVGDVGQLVLGGMIAVASLSLVLSFIRSKAALFFVFFAILIIPLSIFLAMDVLVLRGVRGEWYMLFVQMGIPLVIAYYFLKSPAVRKYYSPGKKISGH